MLDKKLGVVIVFYNPEQDNIDNALKLSEKFNVVIVDNSENDTIYNVGGAHVIKLNKNIGIASAINIGLKYLKDNSFEFALLLDQDSNPHISLINELYQFHLMADKDVCLSAPSYYDRAIEKNADFIVCDENVLKRIPAVGNTPIEASYVITSGSMLRVNSLDIIGYMDDELFIDFVDIEWCMRARHHGYRILGLPWLKMSHEIGLEPISIGKKKYVNHSPIRHYYYFRNIFILLRMHHVPRRWKKMELIKLLPRFMVYALFTRNRFQHISNMLKGTYDGLLGKVGKKR